MGAAELSFVVKAIDQASGTLGHVSGKVGGLHGALGKLGGLAGGALLGGLGVATAAIGGLGVVLKQSIAEASNAEQVTAQLEAVLKSTGNVAGMTAQAINDQALVLSKVTRFEDDAIVAADSMLLTFTKVGKDIFPQATETILDLSTALDMDLKSATMMVGKALNDPVAGLTALNRAGVQFTDTQKDMIKAMVEAGDVAGAQSLILQELSTQVGGSARAAGQTMVGQMDIMKNQIGNIKEQIGGALLPVITDLITKMGPGLIEGAQKFADWFVNTGLPAMQQFGGYLATEVIPTLQRFGRWFEGNILPAMKTVAAFIGDVVLPAFQDFGNWLDIHLLPILIDVWNWIGPALSGALENLGRAFDLIKITVEGVITVLTTLVDWAKTAFEWLQKVTAAGGSAGSGAFYGSGGGAGGGGGGYTGGNAGGGGGGYTDHSARAADGMWNVTLNFYGATNPQAVAVAAEQGVLRAARSMGIR